MEPHLFSRNIGWENAGQGLYVIHNMLGMIRLGNENRALF